MGQSPNPSARSYPCKHGCDSRLLGCLSRLRLSRMTHSSYEFSHYKLLFFHIPDLKIQIILQSTDCTLNPTLILSLKSNSTRSVNSPQKCQPFSVIVKKIQKTQNLWYQQHQHHKNTTFTLHLTLFVVYLEA